MTNDEYNKVHRRAELLGSAASGEPVLKATTLLSEYLTEAEFAAEVGRTVRTVKRWRALGVGPKCVVLGRQRLYRRESARAWLQSLEEDAA